MNDNAIKSWHLNIYIYDILIAHESLRSFAIHQSITRWIGVHSLHSFLHHGRARAQHGWKMHLIQAVLKFFSKGQAFLVRSVPSGKLTVENGESMGKPWENHRKTMGKWRFIGLPSGKRLQFAIEHGHRNGWFIHQKYGLGRYRYKPCGFPVKHEVVEL